MSGERGWRPDGKGLTDAVHGAIATQTAGRAAAGRPPAPIHLRLRNGTDAYPRGACGLRWGEWWTGVPSEVTCPACLDLVHA